MKKERIKPPKLRDVLEKKLPKKLWPFITASFDIVGGVAVIEVKEELVKYEKLIGETILEAHKNIHTVCKRDGNHSGIYRRQKLKVIAGKRTKETIHKESGCSLKLHVQDCYFSVRSGTERIRVAELINARFAKKKKTEDILVMFSGIAPFVCVIGKRCQYHSLVGVEMNPIAHKYAAENITLNKLKNTEVIKGDVREIVPKLGIYDRIIMPLPRTAEEFLDCALQAARKGTWVHLYGFLAEDEFEDYKKKIKTISKEQGYTVKIHDLVKCGQFSPRIFRICVDFEVL